MNISLNPHFEELIKAKVDSGLYNSVSQVVREAYAFWKSAINCGHYGWMNCGGKFKKALIAANQARWIWTRLKPKAAADWPNKHKR